jgi:hypothetical protein
VFLNSLLTCFHKAVLLVATLACHAQIYTTKQKVMVVMVGAYLLDCDLVLIIAVSQKVTCGLCIFFIGREGVPIVSHPHSLDIPNVALGYVVLLLALVLDGVA